MKTPWLSFRLFLAMALIFGSYQKGIAKTSIPAHGKNASYILPAVKETAIKPWAYSNNKPLNFLENENKWEHRIVGGDNAEIEDHPWQVSVQRMPGETPSHHCGGSIIHEEYVITAAHCAYHYNEETLLIVAGTNDLGDPEENHYFNVREIIIHEDYSPDGTLNDIAIIRLSNRFDFNNPSTLPIRLMNQADVAMGLEAPGIMGTISGWGSLWENGPSPDTLQAVEVPVVNPEVTNFSPDDIDPSMILAGTDSTSGCHGDSGGPLVLSDENGVDKLAGATSWGVGCALIGYPGVWTKISSFESWINEHVEHEDPNRYNFLWEEGFEPANQDGELPDNWQVKRNFEEDGGLSGENLQETNENPWFRHSHLFGLDNPRNFVRTGEASLAIEAEAPGYTWAITPEIQLPETAQGTIELSFWAWYDNLETGSKDPFFHLAIFTEGQWETLKSLVSNDSNQFHQEIIQDLSAYIGKTIRLAFVYESNGGSAVILDDLSIRNENSLNQVNFAIHGQEGPAKNTMLQVDGELVYTTGTDGTANLELYEGSYELTAFKEGYYPLFKNITINQDIQNFEFTLEKVPAPEIVVSHDSIFVQAEKGQTVEKELTISNPGDLLLEYSLAFYPANEASKTIAEPVMLHYDQGPQVTATTAGPSARISAIRFTAEELDGYYHTHRLSGIRYQVMALEFIKIKVKIWIGGSDQGPGTLVYSKDVSQELTPGIWNDYWFDEKIDLIPGEEYWIGYYMEAESGAAISFDNGPEVSGKGGWYYYDNEWVTLSDIGMDGNWCIRAYLTPQKGVEWLDTPTPDGELPPEEETSADILLNAASLETGQYYANLFIQNNTENELTIPVTILVIPSLHNISFQVMDKEGTPVDDAEISLDGQQNPAGDYIFTEFLSGVYPYSVSKPGYHSVNGELTVYDENHTVPITLIPEETDPVMLEITVNDQLGEPVEGASVNLEPFGSHTTGETASLQIKVLPGEYHVEATADGKKEYSSNFTVPENTGNFSYHIEMEHLQYNVEVEINEAESGEVSGSGNFLHGETVELTAMPAEGHHFLFWKENGQMISSEPELAFEAKKDRNLQVFFEKDVFTIHVLPAQNGNICPSGNIIGDIKLPFGESKEFSFEPDTGYFIQDILLDGQSIGSSESYTIQSIEQDHTIEAVFSIKTYTIYISQADNGSIVPFSGSLDPEGNMIVDYGAQQSFYILPDEGFQVLDILVDGESKGPGGAYTFPEVTADHYLEAVFGSPTIVNQPENKKAFRVYPNPATEVIYVKALEKIDEIQLVNHSGQTLLSKTVNGETARLELSNIPGGVYLVKILSGRKTFLKKVVIY